MREQYIKSGYTDNRHYIFSRSWKFHAIILKFGDVMTKNSITLTLPLILAYMLIIEKFSIFRYYFAKSQYICMKFSGSTEKVMLVVCIPPFHVLCRLNKNLFMKITLILQKFHISFAYRSANIEYFELKFQWHTLESYGYAYI